MSSDPFSDVLRLTQAKSIASGGFAASGTWGFHTAAPRQIVFSAIAKGACWLRLDHHKKGIHLAAGDVGLLDGNSGIFLGSSLNAPALELAPSDKQGRIERIGSGRDPECVVLSGRISLDPSSAALLTGVLPKVVHIRAASPRAAGLRGLVEQLFAEQTAPSPGTSVASEKLAELLFVQILRAHVASAGALPSGWLRAVSDERIIRALTLMHEAPGRDWQLAELAKAAAMSRTRFAVHFKSVAGVAPLAYLAQWRMRLAQRALREGSTTILALAESLGYTSESAFSNAFKRITGAAPSSYRNAARRGDGLLDEGSTARRPRRGAPRLVA